MAFTGYNSIADTAEQLGAFSGYIRRPKPTQAGMIAQVFGENGDDADTILALSLTKFQDTQVFVHIYLIKDANGKIMKENDQYPLISKFLGVVRRSVPKKDGMIAEFFAPNGPYADEVANLCKSEYQDCLVFVDVRGMKSLAEQESKIQQENNETITKTYLTKVTKSEKSEFQRKEKQFKKMNELLDRSDFFFRSEALCGLGTATDFQNWLLEYNTCVIEQDNPCTNDATILEIDALAKPFNYLPICIEHQDLFKNPAYFEEHKIYYEIKHKILLRNWAQQKLKEQFSYDKKSEPDPTKILEWAASKKLTHFLPKNYKSVI